MDRGVHAAIEQTLLEGGAIGDPDHEKVPDVGRLIGLHGREADPGIPELAAVTLGDFAAARIVGVEVRELHA